MGTLSPKTFDEKKEKNKGRDNRLNSYFLNGVICPKKIENYDSVIPKKGLSSQKCHLNQEKS